MSEKEKFAFDVGITFIASSINIFVGFVITVVLGRYLGADDLGIYRMVSTIYGIAMLVVAIGIPAAVIKYMAEYKINRNKTNAIISAAIITSLIMGTVFTFIFYFSSEIIAHVFDMPNLGILLQILAPAFPFALMSGVLLGYLNGLREMKKHGIAMILQVITMLIVSLALILFDYGVAGVVIGIVISSVVVCLYLLWITRDYFEIVIYDYVPTTKLILKFGSQIFGANAINMINYHADIILIGYFLTDKDVGYYGVAVALSKFFWILPQAIQRITYPATSEYWHIRNHLAIKTMIDKSIKYTSCVLFPIGLAVGFFSNDIIYLIFGDGFKYSVLPLQILLIGTVINGSMQRPIGSILYSIGMPELNLKIFMIAAIVNIMLNLLLIPYLGIAGAAIGTIVSFLLITVLILFYVSKRTKFTIDFNWFIKLGLVTTVSILTYHLLGKNNQYFVGSLIIIVYISLIWFYFTSKEDKTYFTELIRNVKSHSK